MQKWEKEINQRYNIKRVFTDIWGHTVEECYIEMLKSSYEKHFVNRFTEVRTYSEYRWNDITESWDYIHTVTYDY